VSWTLHRRLVYWSRAVLNCGSLGRVLVPPPLVEQPVAQRRHAAVIERAITKISLFIARVEV